MRFFIAGYLSRGISPPAQNDITLARERMSNCLLFLLEIRRAPGTGQTGGVDERTEGFLRETSRSPPIIS
jgi:hypothetical protein